MLTTMNFIDISFIFFMVIQLLKTHRKPDIHHPCYGVLKLVEISRYFGVKLVFLKHFGPCAQVEAIGKQLERRKAQSLAKGLRERIT